MKSLTKLLKYLKPYWIWALLAPLMMALEVVMDLLQPRMVQRIVDDGIGLLDMPVVINTGLLMVGYALIGVLGGIGGNVFTELTTQGFGADVRSALFRKTQALSFGNLDDLETGQLITRLTNDVTQVREMVALLLRAMVRTPGMLIGSVIMAILTSPSLALLLVVLTPLVMVLLVWVINKAFPLFSQVQEKLDNLNTVMQENLAGVRVVKAFVRTQYEEKRFGDRNDDLMDHTIRASRTMAVTRPFMMIFINMGVVAVIWFGGLQVTYGTFKVGQLIAFINYLMRTLMTLMDVSMLMMRVARAKVSADRISEVLESEAEVQNKPGALTDFAAQGRIAFENVTFSYNGHDHEPVLKGLDFVAEPGQTVAILGATGSGKTSLINLIPRFYDVTGGQVTFDGVDVRDVDKAVLRSHIGVALQESVLFTGTLRDNIRYGRPDASEEEVIAAAKAAQAHDFITGFEQGYDTVLGQRGVNLSGGQKQRVAIARALLMQPTVLILDDSTSAVDVETEIKIQDALDNLMQNCTSIVIAQRISTVLTADKILVLDHGQITAQGAHEDLIETSPIYREIYESQLGNGGATHVGA